MITINFLWTLQTTTHTTHEIKKSLEIIKVFPAVTSIIQSHHVLRSPNDVIGRISNILYNELSHCFYNTALLSNMVVVLDLHISVPDNLRSELISRNSSMQSKFEFKLLLK